VQGNQNNGRKLNLIWKFAVGILAVAGAFYIGVTLFVTFFIDACTSYTLVELASPNKEYAASVTLRSCADESFEELNVYVSAEDTPGVSNGAQIATNPKTTEVYLEWRYDNILVVRYPAALAIENRPPSLGDVQLVFEQTTGKPK